MAIKTLALNERPRERLCQFGAQILSNSELLAILFGSGNKNKSALELANELLHQHQNLNALLNLSQYDLQQHSGIGVAKYCQLQAAFELAKRYYREQIEYPAALLNSYQVKQFLQVELKGYEHEVFATLFLNNRHQLLRFEILFEGTINQTSVYPREIAKRCLRYNAAALIIAHNHPSGDHKPSQSDLELTQRVTQTLELIDVKLLDHLIVAGGRVETLM